MKFLAKVSILKVADSDPWIIDLQLKKQGEVELLKSFELTAIATLPEVLSTIQTLFEGVAA